MWELWLGNKFNERVEKRLLTRASFDQKQREMSPTSISHVVFGSFNLSFSVILFLWGWRLQRSSCLGERWGKKKKWFAKVGEPSKLDEFSVIQSLSSKVPCHRYRLRYSPLSNSYLTLAVWRVEDRAARCGVAPFVRLLELKWVALVKVSHKKTL